LPVYPRRAKGYDHDRRDNHDLDHDLAEVASSFVFR
jgi:hypothetical protein